MPTNDILVLGATGTTGTRVTSLLGERARPASRSSDTAFDWARRDTWRPALDGVTAVYLMAPDGVDVDPEFVAEAAGTARRLVLLSSRGIEVMGDRRLLDAELAVRESGVDWTVVRPDWFMQNFDQGFLRPAVDAGVVALPVGEARQAFVHADDIAAVAAAALTGDEHLGEVLEVTGPAALTFAEAVAAIGRATGRDLAFAGDAEDYRAAMAQFQDDAAIEGAVAAFAALAAQGDGQVTDTVERITGRPPTSFDAYVAECWS